MNVNRIMLLGQSSERDLAQDPQEGAESNINFNFGLNPSDDKPWPYEFGDHSQKRRFRKECVSLFRIRSALCDSIRFAH